MQKLDFVAEHRHATGTTVVASIAIFKFIDTAQFEPPLIVARHFKRTAGDGFVKKLQAIVSTSALGGFDTDLAGLEGIEPKPDTGTSEQ